MPTDIHKDIDIFFFRSLFLPLIIAFSVLGNSALAVEFEVVGVEDDTLKTNIELLLNTTDIVAQNALDPFWQKQIRDTIAKAVEPYGYYNSSVTITENNGEAILSVSLGEPIRISHLTREIIGAGRTDAGFKTVFDAFPMAIGDVLYQPDYENYKTEMFNYALSHGYFDFTWQATRLDLVRETKEASVLLIAQSGDQYAFGDIVLKGDRRAEAIIRRISPFKKGEKYDAQKLTQFNRTLNETGYFQRVMARPLVNKAFNLQVPIEVTLTHQPIDNFNVGIGFSTDTGARLPFHWERPWVTDRGHSIATNFYLSEREQELNSQYRIPLDDVLNDYASIEAQYIFLDDNNRGTESETFSFSGRRFWQEANSKWSKSASLRYKREDFIQGNALPTITQLLLPGYSLNYLDAEGGLKDRVGLSVSTSFEAAHSAVISDIDVFKATAKAKWIQSFSKHRLYLQSELGIIETDDFDSVPATMRFFTGGDQSIRGFQFESLASGEFEDTDEARRFVPRGGRYLATASVEYAYSLSENWRAAVFYDVGTATNDFDSALNHGFGVGVHWLTLVGPLRLYLAYGKSELRDEENIRLHFMLGPEL